jgi:hypothetical protein
MPVKIIPKRNGIYIPDDKKVNKKFHIVYRPPSDPFGYDFHHFTPQQLKLMREKLNHISEEDLRLQKLFDLYGVYAFCEMKKEEKIPDHLSFDEQMEMMIDNTGIFIEYQKKFNNMYKSDDLTLLNPTDWSDFFAYNREYKRMMKLPGVSEALDAIYQARLFKK